MSEILLKVYTREADGEGYSPELASSVHIAISGSKSGYVPLNNNYGMLFAKASITARNTISCKGLKNPCVFKTADGRYAVMAPLRKKDGDYDDETRGSVAYWITDDFTDFCEMRMLYLGSPAYVEKAGCRYDEARNRYEAVWQDAEGNAFSNYFTDLYSPCDMTAPEYLGKRDIKACDTVAISECIAERLKRKFTRPEKSKAASGTRRFKFPLATGWADPQIFKWNGRYYFIATNDNTDDIGIYVRESDTMTGLFEGAEPVLILGTDEEHGFLGTFWAPEFHKIGDDLYILFAVSPDHFDPQCHMMKLKRGGRITNPSDWELPVRVKRADESNLSDKGITLDMTYFEAGGTPYLVWSYREHIFSENDTGSMLYIAKARRDEPYILASDPVLLSRPLWGWENTEGTINNEGPFALVRDGKAYLSYSGGSAGGDSYAVGLLIADEDDDLLNPLSWHKKPMPILSSYTVKGEYGPGHNSFFIDDDGLAYIAYHAKTALRDAPRCTAVRGIWFDEDGQPAVDVF